MTDRPTVSGTTQHWAYRLPPIIDPQRGRIYWAPESIAEHARPEYWAWMWGYSKTEVAAAKEKQND